MIATSLVLIMQLPVPQGWYVTYSSNICSYIGGNKTCYFGWLGLGDSSFFIVLCDDWERERDERGQIKVWGYRRKRSHRRRKEGRANSNKRRLLIASIHPTIVLLDSHAWVREKRALCLQTKLACRIFSDTQKIYIYIYMCVTKGRKGELNHSLCWNYAWSLCIGIKVNI